MEARQHRRSRAVDKAVDEFADQFAKNLASDAGSFFSDAREIARTLLKKKAEKDPDWFFEKMDQYDMEIVDEVLEPSSQRKEELTGGGSEPSVDSELDDALESMGGGQQSPSPSKDPETDPTQQNTSPMTASPEDSIDTGTPNTTRPVEKDGQGTDAGDQEGAEDEFEEIFG
jgi:hypothetical protein